MQIHQFYFHCFKQDNPLANIKKVDCSLLPPCLAALQMKIRRTQYVATMWTHAVTAYPNAGLLPTDYGWNANGSILKPTWFEGPAVPDSLFSNGSNNTDDGEIEFDTDSD